jgi:crotonobetainyl-CoA:carnitine CoA-transferase CaiB-like acyl-CoA transferase
MPGPLEGIRVVELGVWIAGPAAGGVLADWGADVVKVEPPTGDPARQFMGMMGGDGRVNPPFELDNRSKRSIVVDLTTEEGHAVAQSLLAGADAFVTNLRMDALERLGLDHGALLARHPRLVYGIITGYGTAGAERDRAAYDVGAFWARSGIAAVLTPPGGDPPFQRGGMGDHGAAMDLAGAVCAALVARDKPGGTGRGQLVSTSLLRHGMYTIGFDVNTHLRTGAAIASGGHATMPNPAMNWYRTGDGSFVWLIGLEGDRHWPGLCRAVGHPEWIDDERFHDAASRRANVSALVTGFDAVFATRTRAEWGAALDAEDVWWAPVQTTEEVLVDPQAWADGAFLPVPDGDGVTLMLNSPCDFSGTPATARRMPPELGEHTDEILAELGHDVGAIAHLRRSGAVL